MVNTVPHKISFIIASVDRDQELQRCIASIENAHVYKQDIPIEILVVIQNHTQRKDIRILYPELTAFYYITERGLSIARNFAIRKSTGEYLVFLDDDATIKEDFLGVLSNIILTTGANAICGKIIDPIKNQYYSVCFSENKCKPLNHFEFSYFMGSAHVLKKNVIEKIGFYDERFGAGAQYPAAEESDIFFRMKHEGEEIIYHPKLVFYHPLNCITSALKRFNYSYAIGAMITKQAFTDSSRLFIYLFIILEIISKSFLRSLQTVFFLKSIEIKNIRFRYRSVLAGTLKGIYDYIKNMRTGGN